MTLNREVFVRDPLTFTIPNQGVAKVGRPSTAQEWEVLEYELTSFVCEGEYERGLERVLGSYLANSSRPEQPAAWVSGFYGSGKSHFVHVLESLWRDPEFPGGAHARGLVKLTPDIEAHLRELDTLGRRSGGRWAAAGKLSPGIASIPLAMLSVVLQAAGLPTQYPAARLAIWLQQNRYYEAVASHMAQTGRSIERELTNLYVSPFLAQALLASIPGLADNEADVHQLIEKQYPVAPDDPAQAFLDTLEEALTLQSTVAGKLPCTLLVFDELQQALGDDPRLALDVQNVVEACEARFGSAILFVATGQAEVQSTPQTQRLQGRFTVRVTLSDTDVEQVVRQVALRKKPDREAEVAAVLNIARGEIDRQLTNSRIAPGQQDASDLVPDYPLLPARRRFWERVIRAVDTGGLSAQLRTQLRIVHEASAAVGDEPLGHVIPADAIFNQIKQDLLQASVLLREQEITIDGLRDGTPDGDLRARLCALIFLIQCLPTEGPSATGLRADATTLADLLVEDLTSGSDLLRNRVVALLEGMAQSGALMQVNSEYHLQTKEGAEWDQEFRQRRAHPGRPHARFGIA